MRFEKCLFYSNMNVNKISGFAEYNKSFAMKLKQFITTRELF